MESNAPMEKDLNNILEVVDNCVKHIEVLGKEKNLSIVVEKDENIVFTKI